eukprot:1761737-Karenia_brevis.AAC.1
MIKIEKSVLTSYTSRSLRAPSWCDHSLYLHERPAGPVIKCCGSPILSQCNDVVQQGISKGELIDKHPCPWQIKFD